MMPRPRRCWRATISPARRWRSGAITPQGGPISGINRYKTVLTRYQTTSHTPEALYRLTEAYMALGVRAEAQAAAAVLGHNYPNSDWYKDAYQLLANEGLQPRGQSGSWISQAFSSINPF